MKFYTSKNQSGVAALMFLLLFPALFGIFVWGVEGARAVQDSARLVDAVEVAALTVAAQDVDSEAECRAIAKSVVETYFPDSIEVSVPAKTVTTPCISSIPNRFDITASVEEATWFPKAMAGFGDSYIVSNSMSAMRDRLGAMDVVVAIDYSYSMAAYYGDDVEAYEADIDATVTQIANYIDYVNDHKLPGMPDSRLAIVGFDQFVKYTDGEGETYYTPHLVCTSVVGNSSNEYACNKENNTLLENNAKDGVYDHWNIGTYNEDAKGKISVDYTLDHLFDPLDYKDDNSGDKETPGQGNGGDTGNTVNFDSEAIYDTLGFDDPSNISIDGFSMPPSEHPDFGPGSASYTGLIQAALLMNNFGDNRVRKIIMLTNGEEDVLGGDPPFGEIAKQLINAGGTPGLCDTVTSVIPALKGPNNLDVKFELFVINYDGSSPDLNGDGDATGSATGDTQIEMCAEESLLPNIADNLYEDIPPAVVDYTATGATDQIDLIMSSMMSYMGRLLEDE